LKYFRSRFYSAQELLEAYKYPEPFHIAAKNFFKANKKFGSKDRKAISEICYNYLRCGLAFQETPLSEALLLSATLLEFDRVEDWNKLSEELGLAYALPADFFYTQSATDYIAKAVGLAIEFYPAEHLMPVFEHYNEAENAKFRPRNWSKDHADKEPRNLGLIGCHELKLNQQLEDTVQVQDLSSQYICTQIGVEDGDKIWDVCCGSGGKSINLASRGMGEFYLSDVRPSIIENAKSRFRAMHYDAYLGVADMSKETANLTFGAKRIENNYFDTIVADVPCSGSGTWFSTPEHFTRFPYAELENYATRQKAIVQNAIPYLKKGGKFYYITCSIFKEENEEVKEWILANTKLKLIEEIAFDGIRQKADGMYMASFG
jgi:16S rRNA (cytosine967-C5)-methyltransferase